MFGVHLNIHPSGTSKRVAIHSKECHYFKMNVKKKKPAIANYSFNRERGLNTLRDALAYAVSLSLEWHAPIIFCAKCFKKGTTHSLPL